MTDFLAKVRNCTKKKKWLYIGIVSFLLLLLLLIGWMVGSILSVFHSGHAALWYGLGTWPGLRLSLLIWMLTILLLFLAGHSTNYMNLAKNQNGDGALFLKRPTYGNARPMTAEHMQEVYQIGNIRDITEDILGQTLESEKGEAVVAVKPSLDPKEVQQKNTIVFGASGRGKSMNIVGPRILQAGRRGESIIVTDPSCELYAAMSRYFREELGYQVYLLNLSNLEHSDCWDCIQEVNNPETERLDSSRLATFADVYIDNMGTDKKDFWYKAGRTLFRAMIGLISWQRESVILLNLKSLYLKVSAGIPYSSEIAEHMTGMVSFVWVKEQIYAAAEAENYLKEDIDACIARIEEEAPVFSMAEVIRACIDFDKSERLFKTLNVPEDHPGKLAYKRYIAQKKDEIKGQIIYETNDRLSIFDDGKLRSICSNPGIDLKKLNHEKTICFVAVSSRAPQTKPIASLFFTFALNDIRDEAEKALNRISGTNQEYPLLPVSIIFDEMYSIGTIGTFDEKTESYRLLPEILSDCRKYHMTNTLIFQDYSMISQLYGKGGANTIQNNCLNMVNLGVYDPESLAFMSRYSGEATVMTESHHHNNHRFGFGTETTTSMLAEGKRYVFTEEYLKKLQKFHLIVYTNGEDPVELKAFPYLYEPDYISGKITGESYFEAIPSLETRMYSGEFRSDPFSTTRKRSRRTQSITDLIDSLEPEQFLPFEMEEETKPVVHHYEQQGLQLEEEEESSGTEPMQADLNI